MTLATASSDRWTQDLQLISAAAMAAGEKALTYFGHSPDVTFKKGGGSPVSEADYAANDILKDMLMSARPDYGWLSEETDDDESRLLCPTAFVVDPIDGTRGFIAGKPVWCVSVAVVHHGRPVAGVLYAPALIEFYEASVNTPALRNGVPILVNNTQSGAKRKLAISEDILALLEPRYHQGVSRISHVPSLAYRIAMVADGRIDATVVKTNAHDWDLAAADLILERAGGGLVDLKGNALSYNRPSVRHGVLCAAANGAVQDLVTAAQAIEGH